jgi:hypothetical protein
MANNFALDTDCVALYRQESGALADDSKGSSDLVNQNVTANTTYYKEGAAAGDYDESQQAQLAGNKGVELADDFPGGWQGAPHYYLTGAFWYRPTLDALDAPVSMWNHLSYHARVWALSLNTTTVVLTWHLGGASYDSLSLNHAIALDTWYHITFTFDCYNGEAHIYLYDSSDGQTYQADSTTEVFPTEMYAEAGRTQTFRIGGWPDFGSGDYIEGQIDEVVIFKRILSAWEATAIQRGIFPVASSSSASWSSSSSSSSESSSSPSSSSSFAPLVWPTLSKGVEFATREIPAAADVLMPLGNGRDKRRPRFTRRPHRWQVAYRLLTVADYLALEQFWLVDCQRSKYTFEFVEQGMAQTWLARFDPDARPRFWPHPRQPEKFNADLTLLEDTIGVYGAGNYGAEYYDA